MSHNETFQATIEINSKEAQSRLKELQAEQKKLLDEQKALYAQGTKESKKQADAMQKDINRVNRDIKEETRHVKGLDAAMKKIADKTYKDLQQEVRQLNRLLRDGSVKKNSDEWKALASRIKAAKREMKEYEDATKEAGKQQNVFSRIITGLNTHWGAITQILGTITGLTIAVRKSVQDFADMEEAMADTRKYTGLADEAVRQLNEDLKKMDTRTSREELNALAGTAGRLGITSREGLLEFVDAADKIKVALGDDLGEGAIDNVGKLAMAFGEDERMGLRGAMLATGSAINELAQNSSAQAGFLVDFTARVAGFGKQLGLTQAQIMGFGAVMDENLLRDEMAATAFGNMLTKMQTDTEKFARIAGMSVEQFSKLVREDANKAILALADNLKKADPQTMMKMLDDMGLDGSRAVAVLATMADKIDDVRKHQERATRAYAEGKSVINEYNTMNNTVQAGLDKAKNRFRELSIELGEKLMPVVKYTITSGSAFIRILSVLADFVSRNHKVLIPLITCIGLYTVATKGAANATKIWAAVSKATPWGLAIAGLTTVIALYDRYREKVQAAKVKAEELNKVEAEAVRQYAEESRSVKALNKIVHDETLSIGDRRDALARLKEIIPEYHAMLDEEGRLTRDNKQAIDEYLVSLEKQIKLKAYKDKLEELYKRQSEQEDAQRVASDKYWNARQTNTLQGSRNSLSGKLMDFLGIGEEAGLKRVLDNADRELVDTNNKIEDLKKRIQEVGDMADKEAGKPTTPQGDSPGTISYTSAAEKKQEAAEEKARKDRLEKLKEADRKEKAITDERLAENMLSYSAGLQDYRQYVDNLQRITEEGLKARMAVWGEESNEYKKLRKQLAALQLNGDRELTRQRQADFERAHAIMMAQLERDYNTEGSAIYRNETAYNEARFQEEMAYLEDRKELTREGSLERMQIEWEIDDRNRQHMLDNQERFQQLVNDIKSRYLNMGDKEREAVELTNLDELHRRGLIKEEEYQRARLAIKAQYASGQTPDEQTSSTAQDMLSVASAKAAEDAGRGSSIPITGTIQMYSATMDKLRELYGQDEKNHEAYLMAKQQATSQFCQQLGAELTAAYDGINHVMSAAATYNSAQADYEVAMTRKKYDKQIEAAQGNQKRVKMLQEKQAKEEAAIKTKYNRRQTKIQIAQAIGQTAINALNAYGSAAAVPVVGYILAPIAAAMAVAAGMIQVAAIKKQAQAQEAGYYEGGFTGGRRYKKEAGIVHEGEFVANHEAVDNPNILPLLEFLDKAQRNNTVGSLSADDISRQIGQGGSTVVTPIVNVNTDNGELREELRNASENNRMLHDMLQQGIEAFVVIDGPRGLHKTYKHYLDLIEK